MSAQPGVPLGAGVLDDTVGRGDRHRSAISSVTRELLGELSIAELTVSAISTRAGISRSNFYFYFDSKYAVLAALLADALDELSQRIDILVLYPGHQPSADFVRRMVTLACDLYEEHSPVLAVCTKVRVTDPQLQTILDVQLDQLVDRIVMVLCSKSSTDPIDPATDDVQTLIRVLIATTAFSLSGETAFGSRDGDSRRSLAVLETLWLRSLWPHVYNDGGTI